MVSWPSSKLSAVYLLTLYFSVQLPHLDAGDIVASHLRKWKNLRKVDIGYMNPVPILVVVGSCGKLAEVVIIDPKHCTVGFPAL